MNAGRPQKNVSRKVAKSQKGSRKEDDDVWQSMGLSSKRLFQNPLRRPEGRPSGPKPGWGFETASKVRRLLLLPRVRDPVERFARRLLDFGVFVVEQSCHLLQHLLVLRGDLRQPFDGQEAHVQGLIV